MSAKRRTQYVWPHRHILNLGSLTAEDLHHILETARGFESVSTRSVKKVPALRGKVVANLFFEPSTRTRSSFYLAASRLSADVLDFTATSSSTSKGETLRDTARNIEAMGVDVIVVRHQQSGAAKLLAGSVGCSVVNAGDGQHAHPTQGLLDVYTIGRQLGRDDFDFSGLRVAIVGDIAHSRVARSDISALTKLGAKVLLVGPATLVPGAFAELDCELHHDLDEVLESVDAVNMLRVQFERLTGPAFPSAREYHKLFGLTKARFARMKDNVLVMHPGPVNRGLEIDGEVADGPNSMILQQVTNGLAVRMAALFLVQGASGAIDDEAQEAERDA
ncbi:MAG: aspartate carbamoyltransferase [Planctomycetaceae bacterium]|nr:aspartate carbamoyltransferase [Planctomycetaceae bacterium]